MPLTLINLPLLTAVREQKLGRTVVSKLFVQRPLSDRQSWNETIPH